MGTFRSPGEFFSARVKAGAASPTVAVVDRARALKAEGKDVIDLAGGDPDLPTPAHICQAAKDALESGDTHYPPSAGVPALREAIAAKLRKDNGIEVDPRSGVLVTPGGKAALFEAAMAFVEPGTEVLIPEPAWPSFPAIVRLAGGTPVSVPLDPDRGFALTYEALNQAATPRARILIVNSPSNPTGRLFTAVELEAIRRLAIERDLLVFSDEIYEKITYGGRRHVSIAQLPEMSDRTLTFNGFSKAYAMTGWRLGYVAGPSEYIQSIAKIHSHAVTSASSFAQAGGIAALAGPQGCVDQMVASWERRALRVSDRLGKLGSVRCPVPEGAFYAFIDVRKTGMSSKRVALHLLEEAHVAVVPGDAFGTAGEGYVRLSFATSDELLEKGLERICRSL